MLKARKLKVPFGLQNSKAVHVDAVARGAGCNCVCAGCGKPLWARKAQKTHHFAHASKSDEKACSYESVLHKLGKLFLKSRIEAAIQLKEPLPFSWYCDRCGDKHSGNLAKKAAKVTLEVDLKAARADLLVYKDDGEPYLAVEIVHTHKPEKTALAEYRRRKIDCIEFQVNDLEDLERLKSGALETTTNLGFCDAKRCPRCYREVVERSLYIADEYCMFCAKHAKSVFPFVDKFVFPPAALKPEEVRYCIAQGVEFGKFDSPTYGKGALAPVCPTCKFTLSNKAYGEALHSGKKLSSTKYVMYHCLSCNASFSAKDCQRGWNVVPK